MDFDLSKENIQPLRGGRNVQQLEMALQAQTNQEYQIQLQQQKEQFELLIRNDQSDDPLENYYNYISWVEQSYPKNGHEGGLVSLLEYTLEKFENEKRYNNDRRLCKLFIKYIDLFPCPLELYQMMKAKNLCTGCADFYKAWAYYYELAGDYQKAYSIFEEGKQNLAQPFEELETAHRNLITAAGEFMIHGQNENRLKERRHALTLLHTYKPGKVGSVRVPSSNASLSFPSSGAHSSGSTTNNAQLNVYEDRNAWSNLGTGAAPDSIIHVAKRQEAPKENTMKPGPWTTVPVKKRLVGHKSTPGFIVHEDGDENMVPPPSNDHIMLPPNYPTSCYENYAYWKVSISVPEEPNPKFIPKYPKHRVYVDPTTEFSIEELIATRYRQSAINIGQAEVYQAISSILVDDEDDDCVLVDSEPVQQPQIQTKVSIFHDSMSEPPQPPNPAQASKVFVTSSQHQQNTPQQLTNLQTLSPMVNSGNSNHNLLQLQHNTNFSNVPLQNTSWRTNSNSQSHQQMLQSQQSNHQHFGVHSQQFDLQNQAFGVQNQQFGVQNQQFGVQSQQFGAQPNHLGAFPSHMRSQHLGATSTVASRLLSPQTLGGAALSPNLDSPDTDRFQRTGTQTKQDFLWTPESDKKPQFAVYESPTQLPLQVQPKGSAMKTAFKCLNSDELAETGSRGGMDVAVTAADSARPMPLFNDNSSSPFDDVIVPPALEDIDTSCTTQQFNFNLNAMKVSTPQSKMSPFGATVTNEEDLQICRKKLFMDNKTLEKDNKALSTILEETKSGYGSTSSSSGATTKSSIFGTNQTNKMSVISEEHNSYLAQNLMANAALRSSLLGDLMDFKAPQIESPAAPMQSSPIQSPVRQIPAPAVVKPLDRAPSDPFSIVLINQLLERVVFPGPHGQGYVLINGNPRLCVRKEPVCIGNDRYLIEKQLGKGQFGTVFKAQDMYTGSAVALKCQRPPHKWEFYICRELRARLADHPLRDKFMDVSTGYFSDIASILVSDYQPMGSLLDAANLIKTSTTKNMSESLCFYFVLEMLNIVKAMHDVKIIHADIKPDNFLVYVMPDNTLGLQLIDFGCSIDMTLFPQDCVFTRPITTEDFICCEVRDGRPWSYHTDLFCIAASAHVLLFREYIQLKKNDGYWYISQKLPRYCKVELWNTFFSELLNQQNGPADVTKLQRLFEKKVDEAWKNKLPSDLRALTNLLQKR